MNPILRPLVVPILLFALVACNHQTDDTAASDKVTAEVVTEHLQQGSLPDIVSAYGTAAPAIDAASVLSVHAEGAVTHFDVIAGTAVKRGQRLLTFTLSAATVAAYQQARSALNVARTQRGHTAQLLSHQLATRDQLAQADKVWSDARSALESLRKQQGDGLTVEVKAPFDGVVSGIAATRGETLQAGAPLLSLTRGGGIVVSVGVEPDPRHAVMSGDKVTLTPLGAGGVVAGVVKSVAGMLDAHTHLQAAEITPSAPVIAGMGYRAEIAVDEWRGWLIPRDALIADGARWYVFQIAAGKAIKVAVTIVGESDTVSVVSGALDPRRPLVIEGNAQLDEGMAVSASVGGGRPQ
ncbi:MAG: efflux RND transporter periplasmic adaptor subunit [Rhodanobacter sp.]